MSATPKTDALFFPYGRNATAAAEPSLLVCMTQYELLERELAALRGENTTLRDQLKPCWGQFDRLMVEIVALREQKGGREMSDIKASPKAEAWILRTGHGTQVVEHKPPCEIDLWQPLYTEAALREQLKDCSAVVDRQQKMLDRNAEQLAAKQATIDMLVFEYCPIEMSLEQIARWKKHQVVKEEGK